MSLFRLADKTPQIHLSAFIAPTATIIGQAEIGENASVWFGAVVRADTEKIIIGEGCNVQDGVILHADPGAPCILEKNVTVGHRAVVHGATVRENALIGIGAIVLNGAIVGVGAVVGAGAVVPPGMDIPDGMLVVGVPAQVRGPVKPKDNAAQYIKHAQDYMRDLEHVPVPVKYEITLRGQEALNPFSDLHLELKRRRADLVALLRLLENKSALPASIGQSPDSLHELMREGLIRIT